jgi:alpha-galactosidase
MRIASGYRFYSLTSLIKDMSHVTMIPLLCNRIPSAWLAGILGWCALLHGAEPLATAPPMGWNSFQSYGVYLHEKAAMANLELMAKHLKPVGYKYFVIDNGWFGEYKRDAEGFYAVERHASDVNINAFGYFQPSKAYFPNGFGALLKRCDELDLKFGVHLMRGIPRKAYDLNVPIEGTTFRARDIADLRPENNCTWCAYNYGVDMDKPGAQAWYDGLIRHLVAQGVRFIKYDDIVEHPREVQAVAEAIRKTGQPVVLSISPGDRVRDKDLPMLRTANMLRVTHDIWDNQRGLDSCFAAWRKWTGKESAAFWIDMDTIPFGQLQVMSPPRAGATNAQDIALSGLGTVRASQFNAAQKRTFITLRAMAASPLFLGGDLPTMDEESLRLVTHQDMIACNQNGVMAKLISEQSGLEVWHVAKKNSKHAGWIGVFNRSKETRKALLKSELIGLNVALAAKDIWGGKELHIPAVEPLEVVVPGGDVAFITYSGK